MEPLQLNRYYQTCWEAYCIKKPPKDIRKFIDYFHTIAVGYLRQYKNNIDKSVIYIGQEIEIKEQVLELKEAIDELTLIFSRLHDDLKETLLEEKYKHQINRTIRKLEEASDQCNTLQTNLFLAWDLFSHLEPDCFDECSMYWSEGLPPTTTLLRTAHSN